MRHFSAKIIIIVILVLAGALFLFLKFSGPDPRIGVCPPDLCRYSKKPSKADLTEAGRVRTNFLPKVPAGLPQDFPIGAGFLRALESYSEVVEGDKAEGELRHIQSTFIYLSSQQAADLAEGFKKYLNQEKYAVLSEKDKNSTYILQGRKTFAQLDTSITVNIVTNNQIERLVTISLLNVEKIK